MGVIWIISIIATLVIADHKKRSVAGFFLLSLVTGPLAVLILLLIPSRVDHGCESTGKFDNLADIKREVDSLRSSIYAMQQRVRDLEGAIDRFTQGKASAQESVPRVEIIEEKVEKIQKVDLIQGKGVSVEAKYEMPKEEAAPVKSRSDMELDFGRNWLNKIGIIVFTLGMGFLISYTFKYFGPFFKIAFGYAVSAALFFFGAKLEGKERYVHFGRALLGGAWALTYFTTYAMHHFEASRLIDNPVIDFCLLSIVVAGMIVHVLRYKSESMMAVALFVAYITTTLGDITLFTVMSLMLLAIVNLFFVYRFQWLRTLILGVVMTYGVHYIWIIPNLLDTTPKQSGGDYSAWMNLIFLSCYWLVFLIGIHISRLSKEVRLNDTLAAVNFLNITLYSILSYSAILKFFYDDRFTIVLTEGIIYLVLALMMKKLTREKLYVSDMVAGLFLITFFVWLKFLPTSSLLLWLIEIPFLLFIGLRFKEKLYRSFCYGLTVLAACRMGFLYFEGMGLVEIGTFVLTWQEFMFFCATVSMAACFYLTRQANKEDQGDIIDEIFHLVFAGAFCSYLTLFIYSWIEQPWFNAALAVEIPVLLWIGLSLRETIFRYFSYGLAAFAALRYFLVYIFGGGGEVRFLGMMWSSWEFMCFWTGLSMAAGFYLLHYSKKDREQDTIDHFGDHLFPAASCVYVTSWLGSIIEQPWMTFALCLEGVFLLSINVMTGLKRFRIYAYGILAMAAFIFVTQPIYASSAVLKWAIISFDVLAYFAIYYFMKYRKGAKRLGAIFENEETMAFGAGILLLVVMIFQYVTYHWITLGLGIASVVIILMGIMNKSKTERLGGLILLALALGRLILVELSGLDIIFKIITFIILGILLLGISFFYNRFSDEQTKK